MEWKVPRGATGFRYLKEAPLPETDRRAVAELSYQWARNLGGTVEQILPPSYPSTYYSAVLAHGQYEVRHVTVLFHRHLPLLALVSHPPQGLGDLSFIDEPVVAEAMPDYSEFRLLAHDQLAAPVTSASLSELAATELKQVAYWQPATIGEVLFNRWDLRGAVPQPQKSQRAIPFAGYRVTISAPNADSALAGGWPDHSLLCAERPAMHKERESRNGCPAAKRVDLPRRELALAVGRVQLARSG